MKLAKVSWKPKKRLIQNFKNLETTAQAYLIC